MPLPSRARSAIIVAAGICGVTAAPAAASAAQDNDPSLTAQITALDRQLFEAYNCCDLDAFGRFFAPDVEFYHDDGGVTFGRKAVFDNTRKYICGKVRRELIAGTLKAYAVKDFGAIEEGQHAFYPVGATQPGGVAKFVMTWKHDGDAWRVTRVLSYGHMPAKAP